MDPLELIAVTPADTEGIGAALAPLLRPRDAVMLTGELGAGKTTLVRGIARGLDVDEHVASPTFTLVREYRGRLAVAHVDVYRLDHVQDVVDLGLDEIADGEAVLLVEWGDAVEELLADDRLRVELVGADPTGEDDTRLVRLRAVGPSWAERWQGVTEALDGWRSNR